MFIPSILKEYNKKSSQDRDSGVQDQDQEFKTEAKRASGVLLDEYTRRGGDNLQQISLGMANPPVPTTFASIKQAINANEKDHNPPFLQMCLRRVLAAAQ